MPQAIHFAWTKGDANKLNAELLYKWFISTTLASVEQQECLVHGEVEKVFHDRCH